VSPVWISAFLDLANDGFDDGVRFWSALTAYDVSPRRGSADEFATLVPGDGDPFLKVQRLNSGADRIHVDLHLPDPRAAAEAAVGLGAVEIADHADQGYVVLSSPGGLTFCFVAHPASVRPAPTTWPDGHSSLLDQVCLDIPASPYEAECAFWSALTGWELRGAAAATEFRSLARPADQPLRLLLQRLDEPEGPVRAHLDWATTDREAETDRHRVHGARVVEVRPGWTVLADPGGHRYCITDRDPETGMLR
jgi:hypothetical protein